MKKVVTGIMRFKQKEFEERRELFAELANGQSPEVLFITCADSRIDPNLVTQTEPGELFICRNAGNIVPPHTKVAGGVTASIEFAVAVLGVRDIVVCGHTDCGAMKGAINPSALQDLPHVCDWLEHSRGAVETVKAQRGVAGLAELNAVTEQNVLLQLAHLRTHPAVAARLSTGDITLHGWVYDIETGNVTCYDEDQDAFVPVEERYATPLAAGERKAERRFYAGKCGPGFACGANNRLPCAWGGVKVMLASSKWPADRHTPQMKRAIEQGIAFLFSTDPAEADYPSGYSDKPSRNWWKFGFPVFYVTDLLQNVEALVGLGYGGDPRLANALALIREKQDDEGRWALEYHYTGKTWVDFGERKQPNKWVTLRALRVLKAVA